MNKPFLYYERMMTFMVVIELRGRKFKQLKLLVVVLMRLMMILLAASSRMRYFIGGESLFTTDNFGNDDLRSHSQSADGRSKRSKKAR